MPRARRCMSDSRERRLERPDPLAGGQHIGQGLALRPGHCQFILRLHRHPRLAVLAPAAPLRRLPGFRPAVAFLAVGAGGNHLQGAGYAQVIAIVRLLAGGGAASSLPEGILVLLLIILELLLILLLLRFMDVLVFVLQALLRFHEAQLFLRLLMVHLQELRLLCARQWLLVQLILRALVLLQRLYVQMPVHELRPLRPRGPCGRTAAGAAGQRKGTPC